MGQNPYDSKFNGKMRFSELRNQINGITERMLTLQLRELEKEKLVKRTVHAEVPPRVEYEMTAIAQQLIPIWRQLSAWGDQHKKVILQNPLTSPEGSSADG